MWRKAYLIITTRRFYYYYSLFGHHTYQFSCTGLATIPKCWLKWIISSSKLFVSDSAWNKSVLLEGKFYWSNYILVKADCEKVLLEILPLEDKEIRYSWDKAVSDHVNSICHNPLLTPVGIHMIMSIINNIFFLLTYLFFS